MELTNIILLFDKKNQSTSTAKAKVFNYALASCLSAIKSIALLLILLIYCSINSIAQAKVKAQDEKLVVSYYANGQEFSIFGKKTSQGYRFNGHAKKIIHLATLNWPPYIGETLCNKGWVFQFTVALLASKGYQVNINFYPWARAVKLVEQGRIDVLFPEYFIEETAPSDHYPQKTRRELLSLSNKFPGGGLALLQRKGSDFNLDKGLSVLKGRIIGVVRGYQNTPEFDGMMDAKVFSVVEAVDEWQLIELLTSKRVEFIVGDPKVFTFTINNSPLTPKQKQRLLNKIESVKPSLDYKPLYFAVSKKSPQAKQVMKDINIAIAQFKKSGETERLIQLDGQCPDVTLPLSL
ncbi:transporter substrate-binding domain-containing protein [Colwellia sp. MB3u-28]|nr:transporter substrate-binding domain-containing protein [Colwellia sp. MB02u-7]MBA6237698.1 transporter substrate-binding domain-containing protein [Colwellia sp. MB02u-11]MBA6255359.1 transporter substrate-binding domain-containing protein [Colwellia sp. MB3u-28]MBA6261499.1 transporter substrate-binding domain-containing protein [Colwellia sp. MB3u-41]MBA6299533.1 transporter substrate-binding domain-containing protein [Colwellia sp. MB3u-22]MBA6303708.1 transporter substrate-binding doma